MKKFILSVITVAFLALGLSANAQGFSSFCAPGVALGAGTNYALVPPDSKNGGEPFVTYVNVNGLSTSAINLVSYVSTNQTIATAVNTTTTNVVGSTNGFYAGNWVVIQHLQQPPRFRNEALILSAVQNTNQLVFASAPVTAIAAGDIINAEVPNGSIPIATSATAREVSNAGGVFSGQRNEPLLLTILSSGAGTNTINVVNANWIP